MKLSEIVTGDETLSQYFRGVDKKYKDNYQQALYTTPNQNQKLYLKNGGFDNERDPVFVVFGMAQDNRADKQQRLAMIFGSWFEKQFGESQKRAQKDPNQVKFTIVFYNSLCGGSVYSAFKQMYKTLPLKYFDNLKRLIVVQAGAMNRLSAWFSTGTLNNYLYSKTVYIDQTMNLNNYSIDVSKQFTRLIPRDIVQHERERSRGLCFQRSTVFEEEQHPSKVRLAPQSQLYNNNKNTFYNSRLDQYQLSENKIPIILRLLINHLASHTQMLEAPGIFRKAVSIDDKIQADRRLSYKDYNYINTINDPYLVASIIIRIFSSLRQPIIPYNMYHKIVNTFKQQSQIDIRLLNQILADLPLINKNNLFFLLNFMRTQIIPRHQINKMTSYNIATVLMPALMRSQNPLTDLIHAKKCVKILQAILINGYQPNSKIGQKHFQSSISKGADTRYTTYDSKF